MTPLIFNVRSKSWVHYLLRNPCRYLLHFLKLATPVMAKWISSRWPIIPSQQQEAVHGVSKNPVLILHSVTPLYYVLKFLDHTQTHTQTARTWRCTSASFHSTWNLHFAILSLRYVKLALCEVGPSLSLSLSPLQCNIHGMSTPA